MAEADLTPVAPKSTSARLSAFVAKFDPAVGKLFRGARAVLRQRYPAAHELVADNDQFLSVGYCGSERATDCVVSLAVSRKGVALAFHRATELPDPHHLLNDSGTSNRFVRLESVETLDDPGVLELLRVAQEKAHRPLPTVGRGRTIIQSNPGQRPRRNA